MSNDLISLHTTFRYHEQIVSQRQCSLVAQLYELEMWANAQRDGRPAEHRWRPLFNAAKYG